jgi:hypothetical protein
MLAPKHSLEYVGGLMYQADEWFVAVLPLSLALAGPADDVRRRLPDAFALHGGIATDVHSGAPIGLVRIGRLDVWVDALDAWVIVGDDGRREALTPVRLHAGASRYAALSPDRRCIRLLDGCDFMALSPERRLFRGMPLHHHVVQRAVSRPRPHIPRVRKVWPRPTLPRSGSLDRDSEAAANFIVGLYAVRLSRYLASHIAEPTDQGGSNP